MPDSGTFERKIQPITVADLAFPPREGGYTKGHETRELILQAALHLLVESGYRAMSMRRIAAACDMKLGNLTYHFPTREDLVQALLDAVISAYEIEFDKIMHNLQLPPEARLKLYCETVLEDLRTLKTTRFFPEIWALSNHDPFVFERMHELYARARAPLVEVVEEMRPDLPEDKRAALVLFISAAMEGLTVFAGYSKPFEPMMPGIEGVAIKAFKDVVKTIRAEDIP